MEVRSERDAFDAPVSLLRVTPARHACADGDVPVRAADGEAGDRVRRQVVRGVDGGAEHDLAGLRPRGSRDQPDADRHQHNDPPAHLPQSLAAILAHGGHRIEP